MKKIILLAIIFATITCYGQDKKHTAYHSFYYVTNIYSEKTQKYVEYDHGPCNIMVFLLSDRIKIINKELSIYYIQQSAQKERVNDYDLFKYQCYDKVGDKCTVAFMINDSGITMIITYEGNTLVSYSLEIYDN